MNNLLEKLDVGIKNAGSDAERAVFNAKRAILLARMARFQDAQLIIDSLRRSFDRGQNVRITCWIMLAEGVTGFFDGLQAGAEDRIRRAHFLAAATGDLTLTALAAAWKAHLEFERSAFDEMAKSLREALGSALDSDHDALARASIVMSNGHAVAGDVDESNRWFARGREHAYKNGDRLSVDALVFNKAVYSVAAARAEIFSNPNSTFDLKALRMCVESTRNLEALIGKTTVTEHLQLCHGRMLILEGDYDAALACLEEIRVNNRCANYNYNDSIISIEIAYCHLKFNRLDEVKRWMSFVDPEFRRKLDTDEVVAANGMLDQLRSAGVDVENSAYSREKVAEGLAAYHLMKNRLKTALTNSTRFN